MDNFIEDSIDYLFYNGGFDFISGYQRFEFRIRLDGEIEITSINNHIKTVYIGEPEIYQFFAYVIFCDMFSSHQKSTITLCKDKNVSRNNLKALNRVYVIYQTMLSLDGKLLAEALSSEDPGNLERIMLEASYDEIPNKKSNLNFEHLKRRIESYAYDFARKYEFGDNVYETMLTSEDYEPINEYARIRWEELQNNIDAIHTDYFTKEEVLEILFSQTNRLSVDLSVQIAAGEEEKNRILNVLLGLIDYEIDIIDIIYFIKCAFSFAFLDERDEVTLSDFMEAIEVSYLPDEIKKKVLSKLKSTSKKTSKRENNILVFKELK